MRRRRRCPCANPEGLRWKRSGRRAWRQCSVGLAGMHSNGRGQGCGNVGREARPGRSRRVSRLTWVWTRGRQLPSAASEEGAAFVSMLPHAYRAAQDLPASPCIETDARRSLHRPARALLASHHFPYQKTGNIKEHTCFLACFFWTLWRSPGQRECRNER